ncbi:MAG: hypothetical protein ACE5EX_02710 [Phycisphaerae bacterium]
MTHSPNDSRPDESSSQELSDGQLPSPRAFAVGTGFVFQSVGMVFLLGACCLGSLSDRLVKPADDPGVRWVDYLRGEEMPAAVATIALATTLIGGIGLIGTGIGLRGERPGSGPAAVVVTTIMTAVYCWASVVLTLKAPSLAAGLTATVLALLSTGLLILALRSAWVLRRFPPPQDQNVVTDEWLDQQRRH